MAWIGQNCECPCDFSMAVLNLHRQTVARPVIPKRGEKDFEPKPGGGSGLQVHVLDRARAAMFDALRTTRTTSR